MEKEKEVEIPEEDVHALLIDEGVKLLVPPPGVPDLLAILDDIEIILGSLGQDPSPALHDALLPTKRGLVSDKLIRHPDMDVKASVLSCIHELMRITAPEPPYPLDTMKEIFHHTLVVFEKLSLFSGRCYKKALHVLETVAKVRSCLILLEIGCDALIIQMFQLLLNSIRSNHPDIVFSSMEKIMTLLIEECDEISMQLLNPLLTCVEKGKQNFSPISWGLGVKVLNNCSGRVKPHLMKAVGQMRQEIEKHTDIVASIWPDATDIVNVMKKAATESSDLVEKLGNKKAEQGGNIRTTFMNEDNSKALVIREQFGPLQIVANESVHPGALESGATLSRKRGRKPNSMRKPAESLKYLGGSGGTTSSKVPQKRKNSGGTSSKLLSPEKDSLQSQRVPIVQDCLRRCQQKQNVNLKNARVKREVDPPSDTEIKPKTTPCNNDVEKTPIRVPNGDNEYREELRGLRVKVFWPADRQFYEGIVESYDPRKKKHKIVYFDGDVEHLRLCRELWMLLDDIPAEPEQEDFLPISSVAPVKLRKRKTSSKKLKAEQGHSALQPKKEDNASSLKKRSQPQVGASGSRSILPSSSTEVENVLAIKNELDAAVENQDDKKAKTENNAPGSEKTDNPSSSNRRSLPQVETDGSKAIVPSSTQEILAIKNEPHTADENHEMTEEDERQPSCEIIMYTRRPRKW